MKIKRGIWILVLVLVLLSQIKLISSQAPSCCFHTGNFCQNVYSPQECCGEDSCPPSVYDPFFPCEQTQCEQPGCCHQTCEITQYKDCNYAFTPLLELGEPYDCSVVPECGQGCCVYITDQGTLGECELTTQTSCVADGVIYTNTNFQLGISETECNQICEINQTMQGDIQGTVKDSETTMPIISAEIYIAGIKTYSNINGEYFLPEIPIGTVVVEAYSQGYASFTTNAIIENQKTTNLPIALIPTAESVGTLKGYITNQTGSPLSAHVSWEQQGVYTDAQGYYILTDVIATTQKITITPLDDAYLSKIEYLDIAPTINQQDFELEKATSTENCGNNNLDENEQCDFTASEVGECSQQVCKDDCTCPTSCLELGGECFTWESQCQGNLISSEIDLCAAYNYQGSSYGCCEEEIIEIPPCINGATTNEPISSTSTSNGTMCICDSQYFDIEDTEQSQGYCCNDIYYQPGYTCEFHGAFTGYVLDENNNPLDAATLDYQKIGTNITHSTSSAEDGFYYIELPAGEYSFLATKETYSYYTDIFPLTSAETIALNITLISLFPDCSQENLSSPTLSIAHTRGVKDLTLTWEHSCPDYVSSYILYRGNTSIATFTNEVSSYIDSEIEWNEIYTYYLVANSIYNGVSSQSNIITLSSGSQQCQEKIADESWCISTNRVVCDENNNPILWDGTIRGSPNGDCISAKGEGSVCLSKNDESWCTEPIDCTEIKSGNIFGLYHNKDVCNGIEQQNYCFYDAYVGDFWTTIDSCFNCEAEMTCFDYKTQGACEQDNCFTAPSQSECKWYSENAFFKLLGKGICYPEDYKETDKCDVCSPENNIFENTQCTEEVCSVLGNCFSSQDNSQCLECSPDTTCESYTNEQECTGGTNFEINKARCKSSYELSYSQDSCNLQRCNWVNQKCIKDGDGDNKDDCEDNQACLKDNTAPHTIITNFPPVINYLGTTLSFNVQDTNGANATYYCLGNDCCPKTEINNNNLFLDHTNKYLKDKQEIININYYSIDPYKNVEQINSQELYVDTILPNPEIEYSLQDSNTSEFHSHLSITIIPNEPMVCTDSLTSSNQSDLFNTPITIPKTITHNDLGDGKYLYTLTCTDSYQNTQEKSWEILIDRIHMIVEETPHLQTKSQNDLIMSLKTLKDQFYCYYTPNLSPYTFSFNPEQDGKGIVSEEDYYYQIILENLTSDTYTYDIECFNQPLGDLMDISTITFTIDKFAPQTKILVLGQNGRYSEIEHKPYSTLNFKLECTDQQQGPPSEAGCNASYYCFEQAPSCLPNQQYSEPVTFEKENGTYNLCYYSIDSLNNIESTSCSQIAFDTNPPEIEFTNPTEGQIIQNREYTVQGIYQDISETEIFIKTKDENGILSESIKADATFDQIQEQGTFTAEIELFDGYNELIVTGYDNAGNIFSNSIIIYLDSLPPQASNLDITDSYEPNNPDSDNILEYIHDLFFALSANDDLYSDINNEKLSDVTNISLIIECISNTGCINEPIPLSMDPQQTQYTSEYNIINQPLYPGQYFANIIMYDQFENKGTYQKQFEIKESSPPIPKIYNHLNQRIDNTNNNAEKTYPITFNIESEKISSIENITIILTHSLPTLYSSSFEAQKIGDYFEYILEEELYIGEYYAHYKILDKFGRISYLTNSFTVGDTIPPNFKITIYKNQQPTQIVDYGIYDVLIEANENLLKINQLEYFFNNEMDIVHDIDGDNSTWWGKLYISPTDDYLSHSHTQATFGISAQDLSQLTGTEINQGNTFAINTIDTQPQQIISPIPDIEISDDYLFDGQWIKTPQTVTFQTYSPESLVQFNYCFVSTCYPLIDGTIFEQPHILDFTQDQKTTVSYQELNNEGYVSTIGSFTLLLDQTPPQIEIVTPPNSFNQEIPISAFYKDHYNIQKITFTGDVIPFEYVPEKRWGVFTQDITLSQGDGNKTIIATAQDYAGNQKTVTTTTNLNLYTSPLTIENVGNAIKIEDYYISSSEYLEINGSYLFEDEVIIYPKSNKEHIADTKNGKFSIIISALDGYIGVEGYEITNNITLVIEDYFGNKFETSIKVIKNLEDGAITIETPKTLFTNDQTPIIAASTNTHSNCVLEYWLQENNYRNFSMDTTDLSYHYVQVNDILEIDSETFMNIKCTTLTNEIIQKNFTITIDKITPMIFNIGVNQAELISAQQTEFSYLLFTSNQTSFEVNVNEPVRCKYGTTSNYNEMEKFPNFDEMEFGGQRLSNQIELQDGIYKYYLICEDRAGNLGDFVTLDLEVNTHMPIQILNLEPQGYTNQKNPEITFKTYRDADCRINSIQEQGEYIAQVFDDDDSKYKTNNAKTQTTKVESFYQHSATISAKTQNSAETDELQENQNYRFTVECEGIAPNIEPSELYSFDFTTDFTIPFIELITPPSGLITNNSVLPILAFTEELSDYNIFVGEETQTFPLNSLDGFIDTFAILSTKQNGYNAVKLQVEDKAGNTNSKILSIIYNNLGDELELENPLNYDIINPLNQLSVKILSKEDVIPRPDLTDFNIFLVDQVETKINFTGSISNTDNKAILILPQELGQGKYRAYITPTNHDLMEGQSENLLFEIKENIPKITLSYPYNKIPYKYGVVNTPSAQFEGIITSNNLLFSKIYIDEILQSTFNQNSFSKTTFLEEGLNKFTIESTNLDGQTAARHGEITLDSTAPDPTITIE